MTCCAWACRGLCAQEVALKLPGGQLANDLSDCDLNKEDTMHHHLHCSFIFPSCSAEEENPFILERPGCSARTDVSESVHGPGGLRTEWNQGLG